MLAAELSLPDILVMLLSIPGLDCRLTDKDEYSALILAAQNHNSFAVKKLCEHDSSPDHIEIKNKFGKSALFLAAETGDLDSLKVLVGMGANPDSFSKRGMHPLMLAMALKRENTFDFLVTPVEKPVANLEIVSASSQTVRC
jgi:ankyrin repeat protein